MTAPTFPLSPNARYTVNPKALRKWAAERVRIVRSADGSVEARFRFDGTTCSNLGRPLAFDYEVGLGPEREGYVLRSARCGPAPGDTGHMSMCAYLSDRDALMAAIASDIPPLGGPLDRILDWTPATSPSGCHCEAGNRTHKWVLALEAIHYTLAHGAPGAAAAGP